MAMTISPQIKAKTKALILAYCGEQRFVRNVSESISEGAMSRNGSMSIPKNVWNVFQNSVVLLDDGSMYEMLKSVGYSPNYLRKLGKYKCKTFEGYGPSIGIEWGTTGFFIDLIATVGTEIYLDYTKKHGGVIPRAKSRRN